MKRKIATLLIFAFVVASASCGKDSDGETSSKGDISNEKIDSVVSENSDKVETLNSDTAYSESEKDTVVNAFLSFFESGEYAKATEHYNDKIYGNIEYESEATEEVEKILSDLTKKVLNGAAEESYISNVCGVIEELLNETSMEIDSELLSEAESAITSRESFIFGKSMEEAGVYTEAISNYKNVIKEDSNYSQAIEGIERCKSALKKTCFDEAKTYADNDDYLSAISLIQKLDRQLPDDPEVNTQLTIYETLYVDQALKTAEQFFVTYTDYDKALEIINEALMYINDNDELNYYQEYYESFAPVDVYNMEILKGKANKSPYETDIYGTKFENCFCYGTDVTYFLDAKYNTFSATMFGYNKANSGSTFCLKVYADGKIIYEKNNIEDNDIKPFDIEIDVTGVSELRIVDEKIGLTSYHKAGISNITLQRTSK